MKKMVISISVSVISIVAVEIYLRYYWGFCDAVLVQENNKFEYIAQPYQERYRFRKHI